MGSSGRTHGRLIGVARHSETEETFTLTSERDEIIAAPAPPAVDTWLADPRCLAASDPISGRWRHFKGGVYDFIAHAREATSGETFVIYTSADGSVWLRPEQMIEDLVERDGRRRPRFSREVSG